MWSAGTAWFNSYQGLGWRNIYDASPWEQYSLSLFWTTSVISTTGLVGDMTARAGTLRAGGLCCSREHTLRRCPLRQSAPAWLEGAGP